MLPAGSHRADFAVGSSATTDPGLEGLLFNADLAADVDRREQSESDRPVHEWAD